MKNIVNDKMEVVMNDSNENIVADDSSKNLVTNDTSKKVNSNENIVETIKNDVLKHWKEAETNRVSFEEVYNKMVKEAVIIIEDGWQISSSVAANNPPTDVIKVDVINAFTISESLKLYCTNYHVPNNPETKKECFFDVFQFPNLEMIDTYIYDVLSHLPIGTVMTTSSSHDVVLGKCKNYSFSLNINMT